MGASSTEDYRPNPATAGRGGSSERLWTIERTLAQVQTQLRHVATKAWVLGGLLGGILAGMGIAAGVAVALVRLLAD